MGMFVLGLVVGCAGCALIATILFSALGLSIVGKKDRGKTKDEKGR